MEPNAAIASRDVASGRLGLKLALGAVFCLVAAGGLLWWKEGGDVFASLITTTLTWCF